MEKDTKRKSQCFADFSVDYVKQFSANDIAHAIQEAVKNDNFNKIVKQAILFKETNNDSELVPAYPDEFNEQVQWLIHGVFHKIGFYDYRN